MKNLHRSLARFALAAVGLTLTACSGGEGTQASEGSKVEAQGEVVGQTKEALGTPLSLGIAAGQGFAFIVKNGALYGTGTASPVAIPKIADTGVWTRLLPNVSVQAVSATLRTAFVLDTSGNLWAMGDNAVGQLGTGSTANVTDFRIILTGVAALQNTNSLGPGRRPRSRSRRTARCGAPARISMGSWASRTRYRIRGTRFTRDL